MPTCNHCQKRNISRKCGGCRRVYYCDSKCQVSDWSNHKKPCKIMRKENKISGKSLQNNTEDTMINNMLVDLLNYSKQIDMKSVLKRGSDLYPFALLNHSNIIQTQRDVIYQLNNVFSKEGDKNLSKLISEFVCDNDDVIDERGFAKLLCSAFDNHREMEDIKQISINKEKIHFFRERTQWLRNGREQSFKELFDGLGIPNWEENIQYLSKANFKKMLLHEFDTQNGPFDDTFPDEEEGEAKVRCPKLYQFINFMKANLKGTCIIELLADVLNTCASGYFIIGKTPGGHFVGYYFFVPWR
eukprot:100603_1